MRDRTYINLLLSLIILLIGYNFASSINSILISRLIAMFSIILAGLFIIRFNPKLIPKKESPTFHFSYIFPLIIGIVGLFLFNYYIPMLLCNIKGMQWTDKLKTTEYELPVFMLTLTVSVFLEEIYFRRIITQKLFNNKGFSKAIWVSALIFSIAHIYSDNGLLGVFIGGLVLGYIYLKTKNIWMTILTHLGYNITTLFLSPILTENSNTFNSPLKISLMIILSIGMILATILIIKKITKNNTA